MSTFQRMALVVVFTGLLAKGSISHGQNRDWGGSSGAWDVAANWVQNDVPNSVGETAILGGVGAYNVTFDNGFGIGGLVFSNPNASLTFNPTVANSILTVTSDFTIDGTINLHSNVDGRDVTLVRAGTITNSATGTINFGGTSTDATTDRHLQAALFINDGTVNVNQNGRFSRSGGVYTNNNSINLAAGRTLEFGDSTVQTFNQNGGTFDNQGTFAFSSNDILNFNGGSFTGNAVELSGSILNIGVGSTGSGTFNMFAGSYSGDLAALQTVNLHATSTANSITTATANFTNNGTVNLISDFDGRDVTLVRAGTITNSATGTINFGGTSTDATTDRHLQAALFINDGTVDVNQNGRFSRSGGVYTNNNSINVATGRTLELGDSTVQTFNQNGGTFDNQGTFVFSASDTLNFNGGSFTGNAVELSGSILNIGVGSTGSGTFNMFAGSYSGDLAALQTVNLHATSTTNSITTATANFTNNGTINLISDFDGRDVTLVRAGTITNSATGTINFGGTSTDATTDRRLQAALFINDGTVNVNQNGQFSRSGGVYTNNNAINVATGRTLELGDSTVQTFNQNGGSFDNQGTFVFSASDTLNFNGGSFTGNAVELSGSILNIGVGSTGSGTFNMFAGSYSGDLAALQTVNLHATSTSNSITTATANFTNNGTINLISDFDARDVTLVRAGTITNSATGTINFGGTSTAATTDRYLNAQLINAGLIDVIVQSTATKIGASGDNHLNSGTIISRDAASIVTILGSSFTNLAGGTLAGVGELDFTQTSLANNGNIAPGLSAGMLTLDGNVVFGTTADLQIELGGLVQGIDYDFLNALDNLTLNGELSVTFIGGFQNLVDASDSFTILSAAGLSGNFFGLADGATLATDDGFGFFQVNYVGNNVVLSNFSAIPEPGCGLSIAAIASIVLLRLRCWRKTVSVA